MKTPTFMLFASLYSAFKLRSRAEFFSSAPPVSRHFRVRFAVADRQGGRILLLFLRNFSSLDDSAGATKTGGGG